MQDTLFVAVLDRSLVGCYCIAETLIVRLFLKKCGRKYAYYLWLAVFLNLCFPVAVTGNFSLIPRQVADFSVRDEFPHVGEVLTGLTGTGWTAEQEALAEPQLHILTADGTVRSEEDAKAGADGEDAVSLEESVQEKEEAESPENTQAGAAGTFDGTGRGDVLFKSGRTNLAPGDPFITDLQCAVHIGASAPDFKEYLHTLAGAGTHCGTEWNRFSVCLGTAPTGYLSSV